MKIPWHIFRYVTIISLLLLGIHSRVFAQDTAVQVEKPSSKNPPDIIKVEDTVKFLEDFAHNGILPEKSDFETQEEYNKRLPPPFDMTRIIYFSPTRVAPVEGKLKNYKYDLDAETLILYAGDITPSNSITNLAVDLKFIDKGFISGKSIWLFTKSGMTDGKLSDKMYALCLKNGNFLPASMIDTGTNRISVELKKPKDVAQLLSVNAEIIIGVRMSGYAKVVNKELFQNDSVSYSVCVAEASLVSVIVRDKTNGQIVSVYDVDKTKQGSDSPVTLFIGAGHAQRNR